MNNDSKAIMLDNGLVVCESCGAELECNHETGDMPDVCPECGKAIDWSDFLWFFERRCFYERNADFLSLVRGCRLF